MFDAIYCVIKFGMDKKMLLTIFAIFWQISQVIGDNYEEIIIKRNKDITIRDYMAVTMESEDRNSTVILKNGGILLGKKLLFITNER